LSVCFDMDSMTCLFTGGCGCCCSLDNGHAPLRPRVASSSFSRRSASTGATSAGRPRRVPASFNSRTAPSGARGGFRMCFGLATVTSTMVSCGFRVARRPTKRTVSRAKTVTANRCPCKNMQHAQSQRRFCQPDMSTRHKRD
jgi:hypothetical protein